jgi:hypothetical protein
MRENDVVQGFRSSGSLQRFVLNLLCRPQPLRSVPQADTHFKLPGLGAMAEQKAMTETLA